ncbi:hypothetical protein AUP74_02792 [Microbulbifer aggregans]|uniref:DUF6249 domain-containing protein n=1 Tax=Microbulbifer aggregans TaxID=1769779 RepID=A0A1C9WAK7_9GAMM|nr:DUF6249 domain-containing protein [Microbulbifer aggregans]AOS98187.1 hypothetical protein AUP74_02792 [Microbulbifer aggregans]
MRARNNNFAAVGSRLLLGLVATMSLASWAQEAPEPPKPPASVEAPDTREHQREMERLQREMEIHAREMESRAREMESHARHLQRVEDEVEKQVRILRGDDGTLRITTRDETGERSEVQVDLGEEFGGALTRRIYEKLEKQGILDEQGLVVEESLDGVPKNIQIGISGDLKPLQRYEVREKDEIDMDWLIAIVSVLAVFGTPVLIVWLVTRNSYRKKQLLMDNINRMVAEGRDIPPELLDAMEGESPSKARDRGFTLIAVGLALFIWLTIASGVGVGSLGLIPLFIGVARFVNWKLDHRSEGQVG